MSKKLKFSFALEKHEIQRQIANARQILREQTVMSQNSKKHYTEVLRTSTKKIELLTWKLNQLRKLEKEGNYIEE